MTSNPVTKDFLHFEDLYLGQQVDLGKTKVTKAMIKEFALEFDPLPFHIDEKAAKASLLGGLAASGYQTGAIAIKMALKNFPGTLASSGGMSITDLKWKRPVMANDEIGGTVTITLLKRAKSRPQWGIVNLDFDIKNQKNQTVMIMTLNNLIDVRNPEIGLESAS